MAIKYNNAATIASTFNISSASPIDSRTVVQSVSDLTNVNTWSDEKARLYDGLTVTVIDTGEIWVLKNKANYQNTTDGTGWIKSGSGGKVYSEGNAISLTNDTIAVTSHIYDLNSNNSNFGTNNTIAGTESEFIGYIKNNSKNINVKYYLPESDTSIDHFDYWLLVENGEISSEHIQEFEDIDNFVGSELYSDDEGTNYLGCVISACRTDDDEIINNQRRIYFSLDLYSSIPNPISVWRFLTGGKHSFVLGEYNYVIGEASHGEGYETTVLNNYAHSEGYFTSAEGQQSHAEGNNTTAFGSSSHAEGEGGQVTIFKTALAVNGSEIRIIRISSFSDSDSAENFIAGSDFLSNSELIEKNNKIRGWLGRPLYLSNGSLIGIITNIDRDTITIDRNVILEANTNIYIKTAASGENSHTEGYLTDASGLNSHAEGEKTRATGTNAHAEGIKSKAFGANSHAEGYGTEALTYGSHAEGDRTYCEGEYSHTEGYDTKASSKYAHGEGKSSSAQADWSHAEGENTKASGIGSHSEGFDSQSNGNYSHAEGKNTTTAGTYAHSEGYETLALGEHSHSEGFITVSEGKGTHSEGTRTHTIGVYSHAEGKKNTAIGQYSHVEGEHNESKAKSSHAEGRKTITEGECSHSEGKYTYTQGEGSHAEGIDTESIGKGSHSEGHFTTTNGEYSHSEGHYTNAIGEASHAEGEGGSLSLFICSYVYPSEDKFIYTKANCKESDSAYGFFFGSDLQSDFFSEETNLKFKGWKGREVYTASGELIGRISNILDGEIQLDRKSQLLLNGMCIYIKTGSSGENSHSEGRLTNASGYNSHAEGELSFASGTNTHAEGYDTKAFGETSHAEGEETEALARGSHSEGYRTHVEGKYAHVEGTDTKAHGEYSHSEGKSNDAGGNYSHAEGYHTRTENDGAHTEGEDTQASGSSSHAEGFETRTNGLCSHTEGRRTNTIGDYSHAEGFETVTRNLYEHAQGVSNKSHLNNSSIFGDPKNTLFSIGVGKHQKEIENRLYEFIGYMRSSLSPDGLFDLSETDVEFLPDSNWTNSKIFNYVLMAEDTEILYAESINDIEGLVGSYLYADDEGIEYLGTVAKAARVTEDQDENERRIYLSLNTSDLMPSFISVWREVREIEVVNEEAERNALEVMLNGNIYIKDLGNYDGNTISNDQIHLAKLLNDSFEVIAAALNDLNDRIIEITDVLDAPVVEIEESEENEE